MSDDYAQYTKGKLKLKTDSEISKKKKKKKSSKKDEEQKIAETDRDTVKIKEGQERFTKAELAFKKMQEKMQNKRIKEKAQTTHKQQVEKFNEKLDQLTEHFDIPKVSWTK
ncbi:protein FAM32A-like [Chironomus tepperi]|uniref:protein FAM32A-like n=1 Tax=Chironomus tepperi TaxID=113505 RepID=UPI00391F04B2